MKCSNCNTDLNPAERFCGKCGTPTEAQPAQAPVQKATDAAAAGAQAAATVVKDAALNVADKTVKSVEELSKTMPVKKIAMIGGAAVVAIIVIICAVVVFMPSKYQTTKGFVYINEGEDYESTVVIPYKRNKIEISGELRDYDESMDGTKAVVIVDDGGGDDGEYAMYLVTNNVVKIADGVWSSYAFAASGAGVAYVKEADRSSGIGELWLYSGGKHTLITRDLSLRNDFAISPNGKAVGYVTVTGADMDRLTGYIYNGKEHELGRNIEPIAIANGAKYVYYNRNDSLYVQKGTNNESSTKLGDNIWSFTANADLSQIIYNNDGRASISRKGDSRESLSGQFSSFILPDGTSRDRKNGVTILGVNNFSGTFYANYDDAVIYIDNKYQTRSVARNVDDAYLANDGKTLVYLRNSRIMKMNGTKENAEPDTIVNGEVDVLRPTADAKAVFYINEDSEIYYQKGTGKPVSVTRDFDRNYWSSQYALFNGKTFFYVFEDELYQSTGDRATVVRGFDGEVLYVFANNIYIAVQAEDGRESLYYLSTNGRSFDLIYRD